MKQNIFLLVALLFGLFAFQNVFAADTANDTVTYVEGDDYVIFSGRAEYVTASKENSAFTKAINADGLNWDEAVLNVYGNAEAGIDINVFIRGGNTLDLTYIAKVYTQTAFDAAGAAAPATWWAFKDTINATSPLYISDPVARQPWKVLEFDGQTGNPAAARLYWYLTVPKKAGALKRGMPIQIASTT